MKNKEIALKAYATAILKGYTSCQQEAWIVWKESLGGEVPNDHEECYIAFCEDRDWPENFSELPWVKEYAAPYWAIQTLEARAKIFKEYVESDEVTISTLKAGLLTQLTNEQK